MCTTTYCLTVWLPDSLILGVSFALIGGLIAWKLIKALIDTIPFAG